MIARVLLAALGLLASATSASAEGWTLWLEQVTYGLDGKIYGRPAISWLEQGSFQTQESCLKRQDAVTEQAQKEDPTLDSIGDTPPSVTLYKRAPAPLYLNYFCTHDTFVPWALPKQWILWEHHSIWTVPGNHVLRAYWMPGSAYGTEGRCRARERPWPGVERPDKDGKDVVTLKCLPDTVDLRLLKGK
jgi:hypothetical protein